jgi:hypothetical protein
MTAQSASRMLVVRGGFVFEAVQAPGVLVGHTWDGPGTNPGTIPGGGPSALLRLKPEVARAIFARPWVSARDVAHTRPRARPGPSRAVFRVLCKAPNLGLAESNPHQAFPACGLFIKELGKSWDATMTRKPLFLLRLFGLFLLR